ncbi:MAG: SURF1 family protein [Ilumatobacter sp.]|uniref:SURF1 family protein n=1 Tax=Ilumatobacter sp. TaxID=1967498 RepID=UPI00391AF500
MVEMYRFLLRPIWLLFHLVVVGAIVAMINLGIWQLDRLDERRAFNSEVIERSERAPLPIGDVLDDLERGELTPETAEWLPVSLVGTFLADQVVEFNQSQRGRAGDNVLAGLVLAADTETAPETDTESAPDTETSATTVIVNRGFVPLGFEVSPPPTTPVAVVGLVRASENRSLGQLTDEVDGPLTEIRRVDLPLLAQQFPGEVAPVYVQLVRSEPAVGAGDPEPIARPELTSGPHLSYAIQWFVFALCVAIGWLLAVRRSISTRRRAADTSTDTSTGTGTGDEAHSSATNAPAGQTPVGSG